MTAAWVVYVLAVGTLLTVGAVVSAAASRQLGWSTRFCFAGALAGMLALAVVAPRPAALDRSVPVKVVRTSASAAHAADAIALVEQLRAARAMVGHEAIALTDAVERRLPPAVARVMLAVWLSLSTTLLLLFVVVNRRFARARRSWPSHSLQGTPVRVAPRIGPAVLGFLRAEIVVPQSLLARSAEEQRLILAHEREHVRTRDHLLLGGAWLCAILFPWHPAVWYLTNRVRLAIELDCDARVLRGGASPHSYGALLIDMAARQSAVRIGALALVDGPSHLERRIRAMQWTRGRLSRGRGLVLGGLGGLLVLAACEAKLPTSADLAQMDVAGAQRTASQAGLMRTPASNTTDFFVNGAKVSADQARALQGKDIGSIEVVKSELPSGRDTIFVTTIDRMPKAFKTGALRPPEADGETKGGQDGAKIRTVRDSTELMVAHVEGELASVRTRTASASASTVRPQTMRLRTPNPDAQPVVLIDGRKATMAEVGALPESEIRSVRVHKNDGTGIDPDAANGVLSIETRAKQKKE
jgi:beta-lactamase regulating signal transducer with metallopeptidase domain